MSTADQIRMLEIKIDALLSHSLSVEERVADLIAANIRLEGEIRLLREGYNDIRTTTEHMDEHIDFVNDVYETVKAPFHLAMDMISTAQSIGYPAPLTLTAPPHQTESSYTLSDPS